MIRTALSYLEQGWFEEAARPYERILRAFPREPLASSLLSLCYERPTLRVSDDVKDCDSLFGILRWLAHLPVNLTEPQNLPPANGPCSAHVSG
jgi:hypothetical protein